MADVYAVFGTLLALGIAFPGMLLAWWLLFPKIVERSGKHAETRPWRCLFTGLATALALALPIGLLLALPSGPIKLVAAVLGFAVLGFASLGAAGIAATMGRRLLQRSPVARSPFLAFVASAVALEMAAAFPAIGWFVVLPSVAFTALGASVLALMRRDPELAPVQRGEPIAAQA